STGGHRIRGRAGRGRDDQTVAAQAGDELTVDRNLDLDHPGERALADDHVVEHGRVRDMLAVALDARAQHEALLDVIIAREDALERGVDVLETDFSQEAQAAQVDAQDRHGALLDEPRGVEHRAVAAEHDHEVGLAGHLRLRIGCRLSEQGRGFWIEDDLLAALAQPGDEILDDVLDLRKLWLGDDPDRGDRRVRVGVTGAKRHGGGGFYRPVSEGVNDSERGEDSMSDNTPSVLTASGHVDRITATFPKVLILRAPSTPHAPIKEDRCSNGSRIKGAR